MMKLRFDGNNNNLNIWNVCVIYTECQMKAIGYESELPLNTSEIQGNRTLRDDLKYGRSDTREPRRNDRVVTWRRKRAFNLRSEAFLQPRRRCVRFHKKRLVEAPIVSLPKCNVCEDGSNWCSRLMSIYAQNFQHVPHLFPSLSREDVCLRDASCATRKSN